MKEYIININKNIASFYTDDAWKEYKKFLDKLNNLSRDQAEIYFNNGINLDKEITIGNNKNITYNQIINRVAVYFDTTPNDIRANIKTRKKEYITPRHFIAYYCYLYLPKSLKEIGKLMGKDHTTILYSYHIICDLNDTCKDIQDNLFNLNKYFEHHLLINRQHQI